MVCKAEPIICSMLKIDVISLECKVMNEATLNYHLTAVSLKSMECLR